MPQTGFEPATEVLGTQCFDDCAKQPFDFLHIVNISLINLQCGYHFQQCSILGDRLIEVILGKTLPWKWLE